MNRFQSRPVVRDWSLGRDFLEDRAELASVNTMDNFTITLPENRAERLRELAREAGISPEELLRVGVEEWLDQPIRDFSEAAAYVLEKNRELYRRLA